MNMAFDPIIEAERRLALTTVTISTPPFEVETDGETFAHFVTAIGLRHLAIQPRTGKIMAFTRSAVSVLRRIEANWASIHATGREFPSVSLLADALLENCRQSEIISWSACADEMPPVGALAA